MSNPLDPMVGWYDRMLAKGDAEHLRILCNIPRLFGTDIEKHKEYCISQGYGSRGTMDILFPEQASGENWPPENDHP